jgi:oligoribonuclease
MATSDTHLIWLDLEMTGLDPATDVIIEIASLITDSNLNVLAEGPMLAIQCPEEQLAAMDDWCTKTHTASGLVDRIRASDVTLADAEAQTVAFLQQWIPKGKSPLCGNSIAHDRRFVRKYMPVFEDYLHYRNIDVSSIKELVRRWYPASVRPPEKKGAHLALDDIIESVEELRWYRANVFVPPPA